MPRGSVLAGLFLPLAVAACDPRAVTTRDSIRIAVPYEVTSLDPHARHTVGNFAILSSVYEPLVTTDAEMRIQPCLAGAWESPDPLTWIFRLRPSVTFHAGRPLRAADVVYSLERVRRNNQLDMRTYLLSVTEVAALDDLTVRVRTSLPSRILLNKLSFVLILAEGATDAALATATDGTGPYLLAGWKRGESVRLVRNERYWAARPALREVEFSLGRTPDDAITGLLGGRYQMLQGDSKRVEMVLGQSHQYVVLRRNNLFVKYLGYDLARDVTPFCSAKPNPFKNRLVRRALHTAIDRNRLVSELSNYAVPATQSIPRFVFGFNPRIPEVAYDKGLARTLLKEAGLGGGFEVVLHARRIFSEAASLVREELGQVGIRVEVRLLPDAEFFGRVGRRESSFWLSRSACATGDASDLLDDVIHSGDADRHLGMKNYGAYANGELDRAIERSAGIEKPEDRRNAIQEIIATVTDELILIPLYNDQDVYAIDRSLSWQPRADSYIQAAGIAVRP